MIPLLQEYRKGYPSIPLYLRGDGGFVSPDPYEACEDNDCKYAIRLKLNPTLHATLENQIDYAAKSGDFMYKAGSWSHPGRVVFKVEKPYGQMIHMFTFIVTTMEDLKPHQVIQFYCGRGKIKSFIKEGKSGFDFSAVSYHAMVVNSNRLQLHAPACNLFSTDSLKKSHRVL